MLRTTNTLAATLAAIGAINWGLIGLFGLNLVRQVAGRSPRVERLAYAAVGIAGAWLALSLALPRLLVAFGAKSFRPVARVRSMVGSRFPVLKGTTLSGREVTLPDDARGRLAFLALGFAYEARYDVEDWTEAFRERFEQRPDVVFFELPLIGGLYRLVAPTIDAGMRQATPREMHDHVVTVYGSIGPLREALGAGPSSDTWVYLLDRDGRVLFQHGGPFDDQRFGELASILESAAQRPVGRRAA